MQDRKHKTNAGYLYVLEHPSSPNIFKVGMTTRLPQERLAEHNSQFQEYAGKIVKETGQKWELKTFISVEDTAWAEVVFWSHIGYADLPFRAGIEIETMEWKTVAAGLEAARKAGSRPPSKALPDHVYAYGAWMKKRLLNRGIKLIDRVRSKYGKSNFQCDNGHIWRTIPNNVAEGEGCPVCNLGTMSTEQITLFTKTGAVFLLTHPERPGFIKVGLSNSKFTPDSDENTWGEWEIYRYLNVEEPILAEVAIAELLNIPPFAINEPIEITLVAADEAFLNLNKLLIRKIALIEMAKELT